MNTIEKIRRIGVVVGATSAIAAGWWFNSAEETVPVRPPCESGTQGVTKAGLAASMRRSATITPFAVAFGVGAFPPPSECEEPCTPGTYSNIWFAEDPCSGGTTYDTKNKKFQRYDCANGYGFVCFVSDIPGCGDENPEPLCIVGSCYFQ